VKQHQLTSLSRLGKRIGDHYLLVRVLGRGSMGTVYQAVDQRNSQKLAVKVLHTMYRKDDEAVERFRLEASLAQAIAHPNIIRVLEVGHENLTGSLYMVQEFLIGQSLREVLDAQGRLGVRQALDVAIPVMGALVAAHDHDVVHRDVKPENIFLARPAEAEVVSGRQAGLGQSPITPKLIDFGVAKMLGQRRSEPLTEAGYALGTPAYMSPEQIRGERKIDARSDVWAMGVVLYEMLAGRCPFLEKNLARLAAQIRDGAAPPLQEVAPDIPEELCAIVHGALRPSKTERWMSMRLFVDALIDSTAVGRLGAAKWQLRRYRRSLVHRVVAEGEAAAPADDRAAARRWLRAVSTAGVPLGSGITPVSEGAADQDGDGDPPAPQEPARPDGARFSPPPPSLTPSLTPTTTPTEVQEPSPAPQRPARAGPPAGSPRASVAPVPDADFYSDLDSLRSGQAAAGPALEETPTVLLPGGRGGAREPAAGHRGDPAASSADPTRPKMALAPKRRRSLLRRVQRRLGVSKAAVMWLASGATAAVALVVMALLAGRGC
jgi:serine/threonine protein kinase